MRFIGRAQRDAEADVDDGGAEDVGEGFDAVGEQGEGMADESGKTFRKGKKEIGEGDDADERRAKAAVHLEFGFGCGGH